jgi:hypothetical protein
MRTAFKLTRSLFTRALCDLRRPHPFAAERVGFFSCRVGSLKPSGWIVLAEDFHPIADEDYIEDHTVGAMMSADAIRKAMQVAMSNRCCMFHVHIHEHRGKPRFSAIDLSESAKFVPDFWHVCPQLVHGAIVVSANSMAGRCWHPHSRIPVPFSDFSVVGSPMWFLRETR